MNPDYKWIRAMVEYRFGKVGHIKLDKHDYIPIIEELEIVVKFQPIIPVKFIDIYFNITPDGADFTA